MADFEEKINGVKDAVANIASEENKQKLVDVAGSVSEKAKGLSKKTIGIIAAVVVVLIALCVLLSGGGKVTKEMKEQIQNSAYIQNTSGNAGVKDLELEYKAEVKNSTQSKEEEFFISGQYKDYSDQGQYVLIMLSKATGDKNADWSVKVYGTYNGKAKLKEAIKQVKSQKGSIDVVGEVQKYAEAMGDSASDIQLEDTILYYDLGGNFRGKNYYVTAKTESSSAPGQYHNSIFVIEEEATGNFVFNVTCLYTGGADEDLSTTMQNLLQNDTDTLQNDSTVKF